MSDYDDFCEKVIAEVVDFTRTRKPVGLSTRLYRDLGVATDDADDLLMHLQEVAGGRRFRGPFCDREYIEYVGLGWLRKLRGLPPSPDITVGAICEELYHSAERNISIETDGLTLSGTVVRPEGAVRGAVVFLHGSGPLDRDENIKGQRLDVFNTLADDLAAVGVASLRYDKRGCGESTGVYHEAGQTELLADARAALVSLKQQMPGTRYFAVGHSEGTLMGARLSLEEQLDGLVLLAPFVERLEPMLRHQAVEAEKAIAQMKGFGGWFNRILLGVIGPPRKHQDRLIARLKSGTEASFRYLGKRIEAKSLRELMALDPAEIYAQVRVPMLVLGGGKDVQCLPADVARIAAIAGPLATPVLIADLTHILRRDEGPASFASYGRIIGQPVDADVRRIVTDWVAERL